MVYKTNPCSNGVPTRVSIAVMIFMACLFSYMLRVNMSINIIAMVQPRVNSNSGRANVPECRVVNNVDNVTMDDQNATIPDYGVRYDWDQQTQGLILGSYFWGYIITAIPGGLLAERWGPLHVIGWSSILSGLLTILTPTAASLHYMLVIGIRFILGFMGGVVYPALHCLISRWSPPTEKGKFTGALFGGNFGTVVTWPVLGAVSERLGWTWAFYIPGGLCLAWCATWYLLVADTPAQHKRISPREREYIEQGIGGSVSKNKEGVVYPALHCLISRWSPPTEKGKFTGALFGGNFGTVVTWPVLGAVSEHLGWTWAFYIPGGLCLAWCATWYLLVADTPAQHKRISPREREYIEQGIGGSVSKNKRIPPYWSISKSIPFWALAVLHFGNLWGLYFLMTAGPKFMAEVLGFDLAKTGGLAALPYLARMTLAFVFGTMGDVIRARNWMSVTSIRKWFVICSHFLPGICLLVLTLTGCNVIASVAILTMSLGFNGASAITNIQNSQDLSPNYAGTLYGIINCIGGTTGFITPILTGHFTKEHNGIEEWRMIFTIGASVYIASGIVFCLFGSGEIQSWNSNNTEPEIEKEPVKKEITEGLYNKAFEPSENDATERNEDENTSV